MHPAAQRMMILNNRHDRQSRVHLFTELALQLNFSTVFTFGDYEKEVSEIAARKHCRLIHCGNGSRLRHASGATLLNTISDVIDPETSAVLIGAVNIHTPQASRFMDAISKQLAWS